MKRNWKRILAAMLAACMIFSNSSLVYAMESLHGQEEASVEAEASETNLTEPVEDEKGNSDEELEDDTVTVEKEKKQDLFDTAEPDAEAEIEEQNVSEPISFSTVYINPLYADVITADDLVQPSEAVALADDVEYTSDIDEAAAIMRAGLVERTETIRLGYSYVGTSDESQNKIETIAEKSFEHTGNPKEGDYLLWQYGGYVCDAQGMGLNGKWEFVFTYTVTYYTTAEQENEMDLRVQSLISDLASNQVNDYQKIKSIYDYLCSNVTYDNKNLEDDTYLLKHTAYAALIDKTAVCQGYAVLFYRLALEAGVDARVIVSVKEENHAWNIVKLGNCYYNLDSTWDAGRESYAWFLKSETDFPEHTRSEEYGTTSTFYNRYPMSEKSYNAETDNGSESEFKLTYEVLENGTASITGYTGKCVSDLVIPTVIDGFRVKGIGNGAFYDEQSLRTVKIPEGVKTVGFGAFFGCANLEKVELPSTLESIENASFRLCEKLSDVILPDSLTYLGTFAFSECYALNEINIPKSLTTISWAAFYKCGFTEVVLPNSLEKIEPNAFAECEKLEKIIIPESVTTLGMYSFLNCLSLRKIELPESINFIGENAFAKGERDTEVFENLAIIIRCAKNSYSYEWAVKNNFQVEVNNCYQVKFETNGGIINSGNIREYFTNEVTKLPVDVTRDGYEFEGWYENENFIGTSIEEISERSAGDKVFYAKWTPIIVYKGREESWEDENGVTTTQLNIHAGEAGKEFLSDEEVIEILRLNEDKKYDMILIHQGNYDKKISADVFNTAMRFLNESSERCMLSFDFSNEEENLEWHVWKPESLSADQSISVIYQVSDGKAPTIEIESNELKGEIVELIIGYKHSSTKADQTKAYFGESDKNVEIPETKVAGRYFVNDYGVFLNLQNANTLTSGKAYAIEKYVYRGEIFETEDGRKVLRVDPWVAGKWEQGFTEQEILEILAMHNNEKFAFVEIATFKTEKNVVSGKVADEAYKLLKGERRVLSFQYYGEDGDLMISLINPEERPTNGVDVTLDTALGLTEDGTLKISIAGNAINAEERVIGFFENRNSEIREQLEKLYGGNLYQSYPLEDPDNEAVEAYYSLQEEGAFFIEVIDRKEFDQDKEYRLVKKEYRGHVEENEDNKSLYVSSLDMGKEKFDSQDLEKIVQYYIGKGQTFDVVHICEAYTANNTIKASYINLAKQILSRESSSEKRVSFIFSQSEDQDGRWYQNEFMWSLINPGKASKNINANLAFNILEGKGVSVTFNSNTYNADEVFVNYMVNKGLDIGRNMIDALDGCERVMALKKGTEVVENINVNLDGMQEEYDGREAVNLFIGNVKELVPKTEYVLVGVHEFGEIVVGEERRIELKNVDKDSKVSWKCYSPDMGTVSEDGIITAVNEGAQLYFGVSYQSGGKEAFDFWASDPVVKIKQIKFYESDFEAIYWPDTEDKEANKGGLGVRYYPSNTGMDPAELIWEVVYESEKGKVLELVAREEEDDHRLDGTYRLLGPGTATIKATHPDNPAIYAEVTITSVAWKEVPSDKLEEACSKTFALTNFDTKLKDVKLPVDFRWEYPETELKPFLESDGHEFPAIYTDAEGDEYYTNVWVRMVTIEGLHLSALGIGEKDQIIEIDTPKTMTVGDSSVWGVCVNFKNAQEDDMERLFELLEEDGRLSVKWSDNFTATDTDSFVGENAKDCRKFTADSKGKKTLTVSLVDTVTNKVLAKETRTLTVYAKPLADFSQMNFEQIPNQDDWKKGVLRFTFAEEDYYKLSSVKVSDTKVLKLGKPVVLEAEGGKITTEVSYEEGIPGWTQVIVTAADDAKSTFVVDLRVEEKEPKVLQTSVEINKAYSSDVAEVTINFADHYPAAGDEEGIEVVGKYADAFSFVLDSYNKEAGRAEGHLKLDNRGLRNGSYKVELKIPVDLSKDGAQAEEFVRVITVKVIDKAPSVKLTQTQKVNTFYIQTEESTDGYGVLKIDTGKLWMTKVPEIEAEDFKLIEAEDGTYHLMCTETNTKALNKSIKVTLHLQDEIYGKITVEKPLMVKTEDKAPTITASAKTGTFYPKLGIFYSWFTLKNKATDTPLDISKAYVVANKVKTELSGEDGTTVGTAKNRFDIRFKNDMVHFRATDGGAMAATTDQFKVGIQEENWSRAIEVSYSIKTVTSMPKLSLGSSTLTLNVNEEVRDSQLATTKLTLSNRDDSFDGSIYFVGLNDASKAILNKGLVLEYDWEQACIRARFNIDDSETETMVKPGTYQYKVVANLWNAKLTSNFKVTVTDKTVDKCVKLTKKGSIDVLRRGSSGITFIPKVNGLSGKVVDGWITGQDNYKFDCYTDNGKLVVTAREGENFSTKNNYKIKLVLVLENQDGSRYEVVTSEQTVKVTQGKPKVTVKALEGITLYSQAGNELKLQFTASLSNENIKIRDVALLNYMDDLQCQYDEESQTIYLSRVAMDKITSNGKAWTLKYAVTYTDSAGNEKAAQVTGKITIK